MNNPTNTIPQKTAHLPTQIQPTNQTVQASNQPYYYDAVRHFGENHGGEIAVAFIAGIAVLITAGVWSKLWNRFITQPEQRKGDAEAARKQEADRIAAEQRATQAAESAGKKERDKLIADFDFFIDKWLRRINGREIKLADIRRESLKEIEPELKKVHAILDARARDALHTEWEKYNRIGGIDFFNGEKKINPQTSCSYISYDNVRKALSEPLEAMKKIVES